MDEVEAVPGFEDGGRVPLFILRPLDFDFVALGECCRLVGADAVGGDPFVPGVVVAGVVDLCLVAVGVDCFGAVPAAFGFDFDSLGDARG